MFYGFLGATYLALTIAAELEQHKFKKVLSEAAGRELILGDRSTSLPVAVVLTLLFGWVWGLGTLFSSFHKATLVHLAVDTLNNRDNNLFEDEEARIRVGRAADAYINAL